MMNEGTGPLSGVRVVDLTTTFMGPYCTLLLAQMGADVIKVEAPGGDIVRFIGTGHHHGMGPIFLSANQGKRSVELDLKHEDGRAAFLRLIRDADVIVTNLRPQAVSSLGLDYEKLNAINERLVFCTLPGFGNEGPYRELAAYDDVIQAISGMASVQGGVDAPQYLRSPIADKAVGGMAVGAIAAALYAREQTGRGQAVEVPMFETMAAFSMLEQQGGHVFSPPNGPVGYARTSSPYRRPYRTTDGYLGVLVYTDKQWLSFFDLIGRNDLAEDERFRTITGRTQHIDELYQMLEQELTTRSSAEWREVFAERGIPCVPVQSTLDLFDDPHLNAVEFFTRVEHPTEGDLVLPRLPFTFTGGQSHYHRPAPGLNEHGNEVLREAGFSDDEIRRLVDGGALGPVAQQETGSRPFE